MKNYFENQKIHWSAFAPQDLMFKSNNLTKKLIPAENLLSYKSKGENRGEELVAYKKNGRTKYKFYNKSKL